MSSSVIVEGNRPVGLLMNYNLHGKLATRYGVSLYYKREVSVLMDKNPLIVDASTLLESVAETAMKREDEKIYDDIIVVENGIVLGTVSVQKMLETFAQVQMEAREIAEAAGRAKSDFLANMSHEIRTPMNAIMGLTELALRTELNRKQHDYLTKIQYSAQSLLGIINDILDFSKIEAGKLDIETIPFRIFEVLENLGDMFAQKVSEKGIEMIVNLPSDIPCDLVGDPLRLQQVLINLVSNSIKFTDSGEVLVKVEELKRTRKQVGLRFSVKDTGIGIRKEEMAKLFESFSQGDTSTTRKYGGTGLGLAICRRLVELMGGSLKAKSKPGRGSIFYFTIPFGFVAKKKEKPLLPKAIDLEGLRVLIVEDNQSAGNMLKEVLTSFRFEAQIVTSGKRAVEFVSNDAGGPGFDLIMLDWKLPEDDGVLVLKRIRKQSDIPVIMMTAFGRDQIMQRAKEAGANAFLVKPIKHSVLLDTILEVFGHENSSVSNRQPAIINEIPVESHVSGSRVLLVDDNSINRQLACEFLESGGVIVDTANDGKQALDALEKARYDAVLMDVQMPEMDGYEATLRIRDDDRFTDLPVIAMTAAAMQQDMDKCFECGMDDYLSKPIDTRKLFSLLNRWIKPRNKKKVVEVSEKIRENTKMSGLLPDNLPGLDIIRCKQRMGGNESLLIGLLNDFARNHSNTVKQTREALKKGENKTAQRTAHNLKGVAAVFSADDLHDAALALELALKTGETEKVDSLLEELETAFNQVMASIEILTGNHSDAVN